LLFASNKNIHAQCIDDEIGHTVIGLATTHSDFKDLLPNIWLEPKNLGVAFGEKLRKRATNIVFDRSGRKYHGCVKAFADAIREQG